MEKASETVNIAKIMIPKISTSYLKESNTVRQGMEIFKHHGYTAVPVIDDEGKYLGSISEGDFLRFLLKIDTTNVKEQEKYKIKDIFRPDFCAPLHIEATENQLLHVALEQNFVPIIDDRGYLCGIVTRKNIILYLEQKYL